MLKIGEFRKLICDKIWFWQLADRDVPWDRGVLYLGGNADDKVGFTSFIFKKDGSIIVPTKVGFIPPEGHYWDFDEETQQLLFYDQDRNQVNSATLVDHGMYGANEIVLSGGGSVLINFPNFDLGEERPFSHDFFFVPRSNFKISLQRTLARKGYDTYQVGEDATLIPYLNAIYECLIKHPEAQNIIISQNGEIIDDFFGEAGACLLIANNNGVPRLNYLAGSRDLMLELLIAILSENNKRQLNPEDHRTEEEMIEQVITVRFADRYELK
ncbi:hypothetical protein GBP19_00190 [Pediococcus acidilactici]|uniref:hypothetical protein n=1 Tax=Pediococcus acidilactici TaxID=1254 RepID=UPI001330B4FF|nr:hypothetical protein [Pediococcus acidilactici]KAF0500718.1 hypothetical protein GBP19_00190 [Pediococcus acidilactici]